MLEVTRFLATHPPFNGLSVNELDEIVDSVEIEFFPPGSTVLRQGGCPASHIYVIRKGTVELRDGERTVDLLEEGEIFGFASLLSGQPPVFDVRVHEDALCYLIPKVAAERVFGTLTGARFLTETLRSRSRMGSGAPDVLEAVPAGDIAKSPLVVVAPSMSVKEAARTLTERGATAAVVDGPQGRGIVTDRDLRARVVAAGQDLSIPVSDIATFPARTVATSTPAGLALIEMLQLGVHHLPVTDAGRVVGMLTDLDLLDLNRRNAVRLRSEIEQARGYDDAVKAGRQIPGSLRTLVTAGVDPDHVGLMASVLGDTLTRRFLDLAREELGAPPGRWAWVALGSGGRREQSLITDQDHALIYADEVGDADAYFLDMARRVVAGLEAAGIPRCESKVMASEEGWRGTESWWRRRFSDWMQEPERAATFLTGIAFDLRRVEGELDPTPILTEAISTAARSHGFLYRLARLALSLEVPVGFFGGLVVREVAADGEVLDIKAGGLLPITEFARIFAVRAGLPLVGTLERLTGAADAGEISADQAEGLTEAFRVLGEVRLKHQAAQIERGESPDNLVNPARLGPLQRRNLRDSFRLVREAQKELGESVTPRIRGR